MAGAQAWRAVEEVQLQPFNFGTSWPLTLVLENKWSDSNEVLKNESSRILFNLFQAGCVQLGV